MKSTIHIVVTIGVHICHDNFSTDAESSPGEGVPFANLHKGSVWVNGGDSEVGRCTQSHHVKEEER